MKNNQSLSQALKQQNKRRQILIVPLSLNKTLKYQDGEEKEDSRYLILQ